MDVCNLALDQPADQDVWVVADESRQREDLAALFMTPPAATNGFARYGARERRHWTLSRLEHDAVRSDKPQSLFGCHHVIRIAVVALAFYVMESMYAGANPSFLRTALRRAAYSAFASPGCGLGHR